MTFLFLFPGILW